MPEKPKVIFWWTDEYGSTQYRAVRNGDPIKTVPKWSVEALHKDAMGVPVWLHVDHLPEWACYLLEKLWEDEYTN